MYIDYKQLKADVPVEQVLTLFNLPYKDPGRFRCVSKDHNDKNPSMSINHKNNTCHCFSCNATLNPLELAVQELDCDVMSAAKYLMEQFNLERSIYVIEDDSMDVVENPFPFQRSEMKLIGLEMNYGFVMHEDADAYFDIERSVMEDAELFKMTKEQIREEIRLKELNAKRKMRRDGHISMTQMYHDDPEGFYYIINSAIENSIDRIHEYIDELNVIFKQEKKDYAALDNKKFRDNIVKLYLKLLNQPEKITDKEADLLDTEKADAVIKVYTPLYKTHKMIQNFEKDIERIQQLKNRIPEKYRERFDLDNEIEENRAQEVEQPDVER